MEKRSGKVVGRMSNYALDQAWLCVVCSSPTLTESAKTVLDDSFALSELQCGEFTIPLTKPGYSLSGITGIRDNSTVPSTLFLLQFDDKTVGKALCSYRSRTWVGPTLELIEIAEEWRRHGLGLRLVEEIMSYFEKVFQTTIQARPIVFTVSNVTVKYASLWFQKYARLVVIDDTGNELGRYL
jgi:GNAT superfamily N-acetyltransferase